MAFHVRDPETDRVVRELAAAKQTSLTEAIRSACDQALKDVAKNASMDQRIAKARAIREELARRPQDPEVVIDKAFFDALWDE